MIRRDNRRVKVLLLACFAGVLAAGMALILTARYGLATFTDSAFYCQAAESFARGEGIMSYAKDGTRQPLTHYPPLYSVALSPGVLLGTGVVAWARYLQAFLLAVNIVLIFGMTFYFTRRAGISAGVAAGAAVWMHFLQLHVMLLSEPLFFVFMLSSLWALVHYVQYVRWGALMASAVLACACVMTRYAGVSVVVAGALSILFLIRRPPGERLAATIVFLAVALVLPAAWLWRNHGLTGIPLGVLPSVTADPYGMIMEGVRSFSLLLLPGAVPDWIRIGAVAAAGTTLFFLVRTSVIRSAVIQDGARVRAGWRVTGIFAAVYCGTEIVGAWFSGGAVVLVWRLLLPPVVFVLPLLGTMTVAGGAVRTALLILVLVMAVRSAQFALRMYRDGDGYHGRVWAGTALVRAVMFLPKDVVAYANDPEAFYLYTGRPAVMVPHAGMSAAHWPTEDRLRKDFSERGAAAVIFDEKDFKPHPVWGRATRTLPLTAGVRDGFGTIYIRSTQE